MNDDSNRIRNYRRYFCNASLIKHLMFSIRSAVENWNTGKKFSFYVSFLDVSDNGEYKKVFTLPYTFIDNQPYEK
jgi:hypothetical protein